MTSGVTVRFFSTTKKLFGASDLRLDREPGDTVVTLLERVCDTPARVEGVFASRGVLRSDITVLVNGRNIGFLDGLQTPVKEGDIVAVVPPMAGG